MIRNKPSGIGAQEAFLRCIGCGRFLVSIRYRQIEKELREKRKSFVQDNHELPGKFILNSG